MVQTRVKSFSLSTLTPYALFLLLAFLYAFFSPTGNVAPFKISAINKKKRLGKTANPPKHSKKS